MSEDINNKIDEVTGAAKQAFGSLTGDKKTETEGLVEKTLSKAKEAVGDAKDAVDGVVAGIKNAKGDKE